jgi:hypothetical protein
MNVLLSLQVICDSHPFDLVNACEAKLMSLMEEFDVEFEKYVEHEIFLNLFNFLFPLFNAFCFSFHQYGHTFHF